MVSIKDFLGEDMDFGIDVKLMMAKLYGEVRRVADISGLSRREIAKRMGLKSPSTIQKILSSGDNVTVETLCGILTVCGAEISVSRELSR